MKYLKKIKFTFSALIISVLIVVFSFPDVIFFGRSINAIDNAPLAHTPYQPKPIIPEAPHRTQLHGYTDTAGAVWQSEPMIQFVRRSIFNGETIFWNPFSATGSLGPETLVDQKLSPLTLLNAITGGSNLSFHIFSLLIMMVAEFFLILSLQKFFNLSNISSAGAGIAYLLNGFQIANLSSNVTQVYFYLPILLYTTLSISKEPKYRNFIFLTLSQIPILLTTFYPTTIMGLLGIYFLSFVYLLSITSEKNWQEKIKYIIGIILLWALSTIITLLILSPLYIQIYEAYKVTTDLSDYANRVFTNATFFNLISLFSPKTIFESYSAIDPKLWDVNSSPYIGNVVFHFGIVGMLLFANSLSIKNNSHKTLDYVSKGIAIIVLIVILRIFGFPGVNYIFNNIPFIKSIGEQYWWALIAIPISIGIGLGIEFISRNSIRLKSIGLMGLIMIMAYLHVIYLYKPPSKLVSYTQLCLIISIIFIISTFLILILAKYNKLNKKIIGYLLIILLLGEYVFYINNLRAPRSEYALNPPPEIIFLAKNIGTSRTANFGWEGLPPEWGSMYGIPQIESINMNSIGNYERFFSRNFLADPAIRWGKFLTLHNAKDNSDFNFEALNLLSVKYFLIPREILSNRLKSLDPIQYPRKYDSEKITIVENTNALPRAFLASSLIYSDLTPAERGCKARNTAFTIDKNFLNNANKLLINTEDSIENQACSKTDRPDFPDNTVQINKIENGLVKVNVNSQAPAIFVISNAWHPDWKATVNGLSVPIGLVNDAFQGIALPAGHSEIMIKYRPRLLIKSIILGIITLILLFSTIFLRKKLILFLENIFIVDKVFLNKIQ
jgi:hypothetical protein